MNLNLILTLSLTFLHLSVGKLHWLKHIPQRRWLSFGGGVAIAYVFIEILPGLSQAQMIVEEAGQAIALPIMHQVYLLALIGLTVFYGLELLVEMQSPQAKSYKLNINSVFWLYISFFAVYNALFSYLLNHTARTVDCLLLFVAVAFHYTISDRNLREHNRCAYDKIGRWVLAGAILGGWMLRFVMPVGELGIAIIKAFLAGGLILNVLKRELPDRQESCFWSFVCGTGVYTTLLLLL
jgi:CDP-diglyceride synthetase